MTRRAKSLTTNLVKGDRIIHKFFRSRGTVIAIGKSRLLIEFDNTDRQQLGAGGVRLLKKEDLHPDERFLIGERVQHWQTGVHGTVVMQYGDRVVMVPRDGGRREICHARHLLHSK